MIDWAQLVPQIAVAIAIMAIAVIIVREIQRGRSQQLAELRNIIDSRKPTGSTFELSEKVDAHSAQLDGLTVMVTDCKDNITKLADGQTEILEYVTRANGKSIPPKAA